MTKTQLLDNEEMLGIVGGEETPPPPLDLWDGNARLIAEAIAGGGSTASPPVGDYSIIKLLPP